MVFTEELYHLAFDKALWSADEALEAIKDGPKDDPQLTEIYKTACRKINLLTVRWEREGHRTRHGELIDNWYRRVKSNECSADA